MLSMEFERKALKANFMLKLLEVYTWWFGLADWKIVAP